VFLQPSTPKSRQDRTRRTSNLAAAKKTFLLTKNRGVGWPLLQHSRNSSQLFNYARDEPSQQQKKLASKKKMSATDEIRTQHRRRQLGLEEPTMGK
jgi:hypothetical protein